MFDSLFTNFDPLENEMTHLKKLIPNKEFLKKKKEEKKKENVHSSIEIKVCIDLV